MPEERKIINRILLLNGGMFDTLCTDLEYREKYNSEEFEIEFDGVFGEKLITSPDALVGFISRENLDVEKAMQAVQGASKMSGLTGKLATGGNLY